MVALLPVQLSQVADPNGSRPPVADLTRHLERLLETFDRADVVAVLCVQAGEVGSDAADATAVAGLGGRDQGLFQEPGRCGELAGVLIWNGLSRWRFAWWMAWFRGSG